jgi:uncharacterized protein (UPF0297 family)
MMKGGSIGIRSRECRRDWNAQFRRDVVFCEEYMEEKNTSNTDLESTQFFRIQPEPVNGVQKILAVVYEALSEKGYDPVNQIVGYIMSGDPTYVTNYKGARSLIMKVERDELVEEIMRSYIQANHWSD